MLGVQGYRTGIGGVILLGLLLFKVVDFVLGLRVNEHEEAIGLDLTQHREAGYTLLD